MSKKVQKNADEFENVEQVLTSSEAFIEKYQKQILYGLGAIALVVIAVLAIGNFYVTPRQNAAANEMYASQAYFAVDSFKVALEGDGFESIGFEEISSKYSMTSSGNLAKAYAGICYYNLQDYEKAIDFLTKYDGDDEYFSVTVIGLIGDAYAELEQLDNAVKFFNKAADAKNQVLTPFYLK
ncbi:MAG: tetratricopeptide repeat protein, partial [Paludibacter sp.]|nr:tetratricopeptide repeat protein [Paludibacter sp.]